MGNCITSKGFTSKVQNWFEVTARIQKHRIAQHCVSENAYTISRWMWNHQLKIEIVKCTPVSSETHWRKTSLFFSVGKRNRFSGKKLDAPDSGSTFTTQTIYYTLYVQSAPQRVNTPDQSIRFSIVGKHSVRVVQTQKLARFRLASFRWTTHAIVSGVRTAYIHSMKWFARFVVGVGIGIAQTSVRFYI